MATYSTNTFMPKRQAEIFITGILKANYPERVQAGSIQLILKNDFGFNSFMNIPVYVISLKSSVGRKKHITESLNNSGIPYTIIEAVNGSMLNDQELQKICSGIFESGFYTRYLLKGEIGCVLSHFSLYRKMIDENMEIACILEDDAAIADNFKDLLFSENINVNEIGRASCRERV